MDYSEKPRRAMSEALRTPKLNDEALAFVVGTPPARGQSHSGGAGASEPERPPMSATTSVSTLLSGSVSMTFRLPDDLPRLLLLAAAERKARRERPFTQQDIAAEALRTWLQKNGYLK